MKVDFICDFCNEPIKKLYGIQVHKVEEKEKAGLVTILVEAHLCQNCALKMEKEIRRKLKVGSFRR